MQPSCSTLWRVAASALALACAGVSTRGAAQASSDIAADLTSYSLEDLLALEATSVAKKPQRVLDSAAAVSIITQEDIRRSGATRLVDVLRLVAGVEVAEIDGSSTAVGIRGINTRFSNSLLVMVDGRSIYVSTLSGVFWDQQLVPLADIERIEVVRGPGSTLWGANAVNGVINIITKNSIDTQGVSTELAIGSRDQVGTVRLGGTLGPRATYRAYATGQDNENAATATGATLKGHSRSAQAGFRLDLVPNDDDAVTVQGDVQHGRFTSYQLQFAPLGMDIFYVPIAGSFDGGNILGRWARQVNADLDFTIQAYTDDFRRREFGSYVRRQLFDLDSSLRWRPNEVHELVVGLGGRAVRDKTLGQIGFISFTRSQSSDRSISGFIQDDIWLLKDRLRLSIGSKFEYNSISGAEVQPSARFLLRAGAVSGWAAYSRASRIPARFEQTFSFQAFVPAGTPLNQFDAPVWGVINGSPTLRSVQLDAFEAGVRARLSKRWSIDAALYANNYSQVLSYDPTQVSVVDGPTPLVVVRLDTTNQASARSRGGEVVLTGGLTPDWRMKLNYSFIDLRTRASAPMGTPQITAGLSPRHQAGLRSEWDIAPGLEFDGWLRFVDRLPAAQVPSYVDLDLRLSYTLARDVDLSLTGANLLRRQRREFGEAYYPAPPAFVPRAVTLSLAARF